MRNLTDEDIEALAIAIANKQSHICTFSGINRDDLVEAVKTTKHINAVTAEVGSAVRITIIKGGLWALGVFIVLGIIVKIREWVKIPIP